MAEEEGISPGQCAAAHAGAAGAEPKEEDEGDHDRALAELEKVTDGKAKLEGVARLAEQAQPKGSTLDSAGVHTPVGLPPLPLAKTASKRPCS